MIFTNITEKLPYPNRYKSKLSQTHSLIINYAIDSADRSLAFKKTIISAINVATFLVLTNSVIPEKNPVEWIIEQIASVQEDELSDMIGDMHIDYRDIKWDLPEVDLKPSQETTTVSDTKPIAQNIVASDASPTPKENLYIKLPSIPQLDVNDMWLDCKTGQFRYQIPKTVPKIPAAQCDVSATTNPDIMSDSDYMNLFPNTFIKTRNALLYEPVDGIEFDPELGCILPIDGFTTEQVRNNILIYPHIFQVKKLIDGKARGFYSTLEIDGGLYDILDVWDSLPESKVIPKKSEFIKEYIVRRYLLERDLKQVEHKYPMVGDLRPFLTLFASPAFYRARGYKDSLYLARACVESRIAYKRSRNPILAASKNGEYCNQDFCPYSGHCIKPECSTACVEYGEMSYLLERNRLDRTNSVFNRSPAVIKTALDVLHKADKALMYFISDHVKDTSNLLTYLSICEHWYGNCLHCYVYHLDLYKHIESIQRSWNLNNLPEDLEYEQIWIESAKILIISNFEYLQFKDFQSQTLLNIINNRINLGYTTILVGPNLNTLVGANNSVFFSRLKDLLGKAVYRP